VTHPKETKRKEKKRKNLGKEKEKRVPAWLRGL
jgi:hypothetical protein